MLDGAAAARNGNAMRLDPAGAGQPPPQAAASLNLARMLTASGEHQEALALYRYAIEPCSSLSH